MAIITNIIRNSLNLTLALLPFSLLNRIQEKKLLLPLYHTVSNSRIPHVVHLFQYCDVKQFEKDLDFLQKYFTPISMVDLMNNLKGNLVLPDKSFLISFDDGHREVAEIIAPILKRRSVPAFFFLNTAFIDNKDMSFRYKASLIIDRLETTMQSDVIHKLSTIVNAKKPTLTNLKTAVLSINYQHRHLLEEVAKVLQIDFNEYLREKKPYMTSHEIRNLIDQGFMIGSHSVDHPLFRDLSLDAQLAQVLTSQGKLREQFSVTYNAFAFPFNDAGVSNEFYDQTHINGLIDISFGTSDFMKGRCVNNLQRQPMEGRGHHAEEIYKGLLSQEILTSIKLRFFK